MHVASSGGMAHAGVTVSIGGFKLLTLGPLDTVSDDF